MPLPKSRNWQSTVSVGVHDAFKELGFFDYLVLHLTSWSQNNFNNSSHYILIPGREKRASIKEQIFLLTRFVILTWKEFCESHSESHPLNANVNANFILKFGYAVNERVKNRS